MTTWWPWLGLVARLVLGGVLVVAAAVKLPDPEASVRAVRAYRLLPDGVERLVGYGLPPLEAVVGLLLLVGLSTRFAAVVGGLLMAAFVVGIASAWARGLQIECGCFGGGGQAQGDQSGTYALEIARDVGLLALAVLLVMRPQTPWSVDRVLLGHVEDPAHVDDREVP